MAQTKETLALQILQHSRTVLCEEFPGFDGAFASLPPKLGGVPTAGTDGVRLYADPDFLIARFAADPAALRRGYLHILLHCLYLHLFAGRQGRTWHLACDMAVEQVLTKELSPVPDPVREAALVWLGPEIFSAEQIDDRLQTGKLPAPLEALEAAFRFDGHRLWGSCTAPGLRENWERLLRSAGKNRRGGKQAGTRAGTGSEQIAPSQGTMDYRRYLERFMESREELELDLESFDYIYYTLGMERYGNLPLIEPLEYREVNRLRELVIAIDTSGSCPAETVQRFLSETFSIFRQKENFFKEMKVYLIQCDCVIQDVRVIRSEADWRACANGIRIQGRGGTDFTPVFRYVEQLRADKELRDLRALLYFTDGDGVYPRRAPDYEVAFVFVEETPGMTMAPPWARRLLATEGGTA